MKLGPCACQGCGQPVYWSRWYGQWTGHSGRWPHVCPGPLCGALMKSRERCARTAGHGREHRSAYSLENARIARSGLARAREVSYNGHVGSSGKSNTIADGTRVLATTQDAGVIAFRGSSS